VNFRREKKANIRRRSRKEEEIDKTEERENEGEEGEK